MKSFVQGSFSALFLASLASPAQAQTVTSPEVQASATAEAPAAEAPAAEAPAAEAPAAEAPAAEAPASREGHEGRGPHKGHGPHDGHKGHEDHGPHGEHGSHKEPAHEGPAPSVAIGTSVDNFLGFNVHFAGAVPVAKDIELLLVGTIFTGVQFGDNSVPVTAEDGTVTSAKNNAIGLFVPVGPAVRFKFFERKLSVMPFVELANGGLLSGQRFNPDQSQHTGALAEGLVPGLSVGTKLGDFSGSLKGAYFFPIQNLGPHRIQLLRVTANAMYKVGSLFSIGLLGDWMTVLERTETPNFQNYDDFLFVGPQLDFRFTEHAALSLAGGPDLARTPAGEENNGRTFYRVTLHTEF